MFWKLTALSSSSPVESILDKENFTLEELLDEEDIIQECKALNSRLINFLRDRAQVEHLLRYVVEEPPEDADSKRAFKFPFMACEIFTCEIDVILKTLVEEEELMNLLFSFLEPNRPHSALLAGYFCKVVVCLMLRKSVPIMNYVQMHQDVFRQLVDLIGITSIMEVLVRLVGADDHVYPNFSDVMQWLADSNLLGMIVDKLSPSCPPEVHANAAETLCAITRNAPSVLASKLSSPSFVARIFGHALEDSHSKSGLVHSLSVCISLLDPKKSEIASPLMHSFRSQHMYEPPIPVNSETINAMLPKLGDLLMLMNVSSDEKILPTTYGELRPPLRKHRLKIVEFIAVLLRTGDEAAEKELVSSGTIQRVLDLFFEYPYNNALHHHVESIILSCLESKNDTIVDHLLQECDLIGRFLQTDKNSILSGDSNQPTLPAAGKCAPRAGNIGHITRISNKILQLGSSKSCIQACLQENREWNEWQANVLQERNAVENVYRWACGRPTAFQDRTRDSDEDDLHDRDYDVAALTNNLSQAFSYKIYGNDDNEHHGALDRSMNCTHAHSPIPTVKSPFHLLLNPNFKYLIHPTSSRVLIIPPNHPTAKPLLSHCSKSPNFNSAKKRNFQVKASTQSNNGETGNWVSRLPTRGLAADKVLRLISSATSSPIGQFISSPTTFLHSVDPRIKLVWLLALVVLPARAQIVVRFGLVVFIAFLSVLVLPKHVWTDQLARVSLLCGILFVLSGLGADGAPQLVQSRTPPSSLTGLPDLPTSLSGYSYLIMKLGPLQFTRKGLSVASTASCLTFIIFQSASLCLATTTPEQLAFALRWFMLPLRRVGVPVAEIVLTLMLSLRFINLVFDEVRNVALGIVSRRINWQQLTMTETIDIFASYIRRIFKNIFNHAEQISQAMIVRGFRGDSNAHKLYFLSESSIGMADLISLFCLIGVACAALSSEYFLV